MYRTNRPAPTRPKPIRKSPAIPTSRNSAGPCWSSGYAAIACPAVSAEAPVVAICINCELANNPPTVGETTVAYSPETGFTPVNAAVAIPEGTLTTALVRPASRSDARLRRRDIGPGPPAAGFGTHPLLTVRRHPHRRLIRHSIRTRCSWHRPRDGYLRAPKCRPDRRAIRTAPGPVNRTAARPADSTAPGPPTGHRLIAPLP